MPIMKKAVVKSVTEEIYKSSLKLLEQLGPEETYEIILEEALRLIDGKVGSVMLERGGQLQRVYSNSEALRTVIPRKDGFMTRAFKSNKPQVIEANKVAVAHPQINRTKTSTDFLIPLSYKKKQIGLLTVLATGNKNTTKEKLETLKLFGPVATLAIMKANLYDETKKALLTRDLFISTAAHELRTPTTTIQGYIQMMIKKQERGESIPQKWVTILHAETIRLGNLLRELLQIEQIKTGQFKYNWKKNSLREIIKRALANAKVNHPEHKTVFEDKLTDKNDLFYSDFDKLLQAIYILVNNSAKFSPKGNKIVIGLSKNNNFFHIFVKDYGRGISKKDLPHIFEGFFKGRHNTKEGFGLGLFLAENIVQRHGGTITAKSILGKGTTVSINLPTYD